LWNTKSEHYRYKTTRENALQEIPHELNFPQLTIVGGVKLKIKAVRTNYVVELAKVINREEVVQAYTTLTCPNFLGSKKHSYCCVTFVFQEPQWQKRLLLKFFPHLLIKQLQTTHI
jgi:hypothetical protein